MYHSPKNFIFSSLLILIISVLFSFCSKSSESHVYPCYVLAEEPAIDGKIESDPAWEHLPETTGFVTVFINEFGMNFPPSQQTFFKLGYNSHNLFLAATCEEPWVQYLKEDKSSDDEFIKDDGIEFFISPINGSVFHQFIVNALGSRWSGKGIEEEKTTSGDWEAKSLIQKNSYTIEMKIPFEKLGGTPEKNQTWKMNIGRNIITINCPENRKTSWAPVRENFSEPENFGQVIFKDTQLSKNEAQQIEQVLKKKSDEIFQRKEELLAEFELTEQKKEEEYRNKVEKTGRGITGVTQGPADLISPPDVPAGEIWRYGLGFPMQISPDEAALLCNIRMEGSGNIDFEIGTDVVIFDDLSKISAENAIPISRYERIDHPQKGNLIVRKGPVIGGFVPVGAKRADGSPHPHAGSGFGMCWAISHQTDSDGRFNYLNIVERYAMLFQFSYDGENFQILNKKPVDSNDFLPDWNLVGNFITNAIPDGDDLLYVMIARVGKIAVAGVTRWQHGADGWSPVSFTPVTGNDATWSEPSLIRVADGNLLFSARSADRAEPTIAFDIAVWRSIDNGETWNKVIHEKNRRSRSPISINRTADGTPYIAANTPPLRRTREVLCFWPLDESHTKLECRMTARNAPAEFGPAPSGSWWRIDHPTSAVIRLADGRWHNILSYRIVDNGEVEGSAEPALQTGCYVEEVFSKGEAVGMWNFK